jgi:GNAT superfamily N-acetyltransferase
MEPLNLNDENHKAHVFRLALRNQVYTDDIFFGLYGKVPNHVRRGMNKEQFNKMKCLFESKKWGEGYGGYFTTDSFMLTYEREDDIGIDLLFVLVDKSARNQGLGSNLLNQIKQNIIIAKIDDGMEAWYEKRGFMTPYHPYTALDFLCNPSLHKKMYFIPIDKK